MTGVIKACKSLQANQSSFFSAVLGRSIQSTSTFFNTGLDEQAITFNNDTKNSFKVLWNNPKYSRSVLSQLDKQGVLDNFMTKSYFSSTNQTQKNIVDSSTLSQGSTASGKLTKEIARQHIQKIVSSSYFKTLVSLAPLALVASSSFADVPEKWQIGLQDPATPYAQNQIDIHLETLTLCWFMACMNLYLLIRFALRYNRTPYDNSPVCREYDHPYAEAIWTLTPVAAVCALAVSAFGLLYSEEVLMHRDSYTGLTVKIIGRQWYWTYNYPPFMEDFDGDSYRLPDDELEDGQFRLLDVDNRMVLPTNTPIRLIITASDVLHSWAVPSFGIKCDAVPGRLNMVNTIIKRPGVFYGQCSELCGIQHFGMPICVVAIPPDDDLWH